jgi:hypothetical protein
MLLHLVLSQQLKKRPKGLPAERHVLVTEDGKVHQQVLADGAKMGVFTGASAVFHLPDAVEVVNTDFTKLEAAIAKKKLGGVNTVFSALRRAQSLTIQHVSTTLDVQRDVAKQLLDLLVASGAYTKYYSYWRRTPAFSEWLMNRKEKE